MGPKILYNHKEYRWWVVRNSHFCHFCLIKNPEALYHNPNHPGRLGLQSLKLRNGKGQYTKGYWNTMARIFASHINKYHPEVKITRQDAL